MKNALLQMAIKDNDKNRTLSIIKEKKGMKYKMTSIPLISSNFNFLF